MYSIAYLNYFVFFFPIREHFFLERGMGRRNSGEGHYLFACPKREGQHKFYTTKWWVTIKFTASRGRVTFFKGGPGDFTFMLIGIPQAHPPSKK